MSRFATTILLLLVIAGVGVRAGETLAEFNPLFPWVNSGPYVLANQKEKLVVLYFFSEQ